MNPKELEYAISNRVYSAFKYLLIFLFVFLIMFIFILSIFNSIYNWSSLNRDDTDGEKRSNMQLHTDHKTGCQYLSVNGGGLTPRLNADGSHRCFK